MEYLRFSLINLKFKLKLNFSIDIITKIIINIFNKKLNFLKIYIN